MGANLAKLVHRAEAADDCVVTHDDVAAQRAVVGKNDMVSDNAVVPDMAVGEKVSVAADRRVRTGSGASIDGAGFAKGIGIANLQVGRLPLVFEILGALPDRRVGKEFVFLSDLGGAIDLGVRYFDTADAYGAGHSEQILSRALRGVGDDILVSTKFGGTFDAATRTLTGSSDDPAYVRSAIEASLRRLRRERLDLVFFHLNGHPVEKSEPVFDTLADLRRAGKPIRFERIERPQ